MARLLPKQIAYPLEAAGAVILFGVFRLLPVDAASAIGGLLGRTVGPLTAISRRADRNLRRAMPELSEAERARILRGMWDNLGRVLAEYPHIATIARNSGRGGRVEIAGVEHTAAIHGTAKPAILFSAHLANWEVCALAARDFGVNYVQVYRAANNPIIDFLVRRLRRLGDDAIVPKGAAGARKAIAALQSGRILGMLVDQKMNDGIAAPFFGIEAMTAPALAQLGLRFKCPIMPVQIIRLKGCRFRLVAHPPLQLTETGNRQADLRAAMTQVNAILESWIRQRPEQWLWLHRRWPG